MDVSNEGADGSVVVLTDGTVTLRPWTAHDAWFMAEASADSAVRRFNGTLDRLGYPAPPMSVEDAEAVIREFTSSWQAFRDVGDTWPRGGVRNRRRHVR